MAELTKVIGGKVTCGLTICPKQYESKRADVELTFSVGPDDSYEDIFDRASRAVINRARQMCDLPKLGGDTPKAVVTKTSVEPQVPASGLFD